MRPWGYIAQPITQTPRKSTNPAGVCVSLTPQTWLERSGVLRPGSVIVKMKRKDVLLSSAFLVVYCGVTICVATEEREGVFRRPLNLTEAEVQRLQNLWAKYGPDYSAYDKTSYAYPCSMLPKSPTVPKSVHSLRPGDVNIVGAMGDSLSAGTGLAAHTILGDLIQYRGLTWSGGGQSNFEDQITVPNILRKYNPELYGFATGNGKEDSKHAFFNVAVSGSTSSDLLPQARKLIDRMKTDPKVDFANDWKVVTILSGNNDLCDYCNKKDIYNVLNFRKNVEAALDLLQAELPRTLVNLVEPLNVEMLTDLNKGIICSAVHLYACDCAAFPAGPEAERKLIYEADMYQLAVEEIARSGRYDTTDDFTVVHQPFLNETYLPRTADGEPDLSYFAPDCFHLSRKGQAAAASALWNNMVEPVDKKRTAWAPGEAIECPTEDQPFIFTNKNSDMKLQAGRPNEAHASPTTPSPALSDSGRAPEGSVAAAVVGVCVVVAVSVLLVYIVVVVLRRKRRFSYYHI
ncbi:phospholipase B1, membrane-associated-like [Babylonia areolata]|uniref:phospholipase B1, membrane-associated-like n=1 Tax=Babylonia areolata TaxID=304850 RepID=UPI003FD0C148